MIEGFVLNGQQKWSSTQINNHLQSPSPYFLFCRDAECASRYAFYSSINVREGLKGVDAGNVRPETTCRNKELKAAHAAHVYYLFTRCYGAFLRNFFTDRGNSVITGCDQNALRKRCGLGHIGKSLASGINCTLAQVFTRTSGYGHHPVAGGLKQIT